MLEIGAQAAEIRRRPRASHMFCGRPGWVSGFLRRQPAFGLQRRHAAKAGGGHRLAVLVVGHVAGGEYPLDIGGGRIGAVLI